MAMAISVYAEDEPVYETTKEYTVTINDNSHTTFNAIQIFKGNQKITGNDDEPLGNIAKVIIQLEKQLILLQLSILS